MYSYRLGALYFFTAIIFSACRPELPVTSTIRIDMESSTVPLNDNFYGLSIEEGELEAIKAELIRNGGFDEHDSIPGWRALAPYNYIGRSASRPVQPDDIYSLMVSANPAGPDRRGGVAASGYEGISLRRGERYSFGCYLRTSSTVTPVQLDVCLEDSAGAKLSLPLALMPSYSWTQHRHTFIATDDAVGARLVFSMREASMFLIDRVSLVPQTTWQNRGLRQDVMEIIDSISPTFILGQGDVHHIYNGIAHDLKARQSIDSVRTAQRAFYADANWLMADHDFERLFPAGLRIHGLGCISPGGATLGAAIAQACFMIRAESRPQTFKQIIFTPVAGRRQAGGSDITPLIFVEPGRAYASPAGHLLQIFSRNAGDVILPAEVSAYARPQVEQAAPAVDIRNGSVETLALETRKSNAADSIYNYEIAASFRRLTDSASFSLHITRTLSIGISGRSYLLYRHSGAIVDTIGLGNIDDIAADRPFHIRVACRYDTVLCYLNNALAHRSINPNLPSLVANATFDNSTRTILLKVVNTTHHAEKTAIKIHGGKLHRTADIIRLKGEPHLQNSAASPHSVAPEYLSHSFPRRRNLIYDFPPNSVTLIKLRVD
ncbi:MAG: hypothetical protein LBD21_00330 [Tannerellaceae bacterium]|jgi:hypothetical protein|nr:hypothetical protein [Tannerellaceae bacterium]